MRPDDCRNRPGAEPRLARRAGVLPERDGTFILDHSYVGSIDRAELEDVAVEEEPGVWCLPDLATAVSFTLETTTNDCN